MVGVGVEDPDAAGLALGLEPPGGAAVAGQGRRGLLGLDSELHGGGEGGGRVERVVPPRHPQLKIKIDCPERSRAAPAGGSARGLPPASGRLGRARSACRRNDVRMPLVVTSAIR